MSAHTKPYPQTCSPLRKSCKDSRATVQSTSKLRQSKLCLMAEIEDITTRIRAWSARRGEPQLRAIVLAHSTPLLLNRDRTTGMSGEGNRGDVIGRILVHPQDPTQSYSAALVHPTLAFILFLIRPASSNPLTRLTPALVPSNVPCVSV